MVNLKGSVVAEAISSAKQRLGEAKFKELMAHMDAAARKVLEQPILPMSWISLDLWARFLEADVEFSYHGDERALVARTEAVIEKQLKGIYKNFVGASPEAMLKNLNVITASYYQGVKADAQMTGPKTAVVRYVGFEKQHRVVASSLVGFYRKALELAGARSLNVRFTTPIDAGKGYAELTISWS